MDLLKDLTMSLLNINFLMIYIIHKMLLLLKNHLNYLKSSTFEWFFKEYIRLLIFFKTFFFITYNNRKFKSRRRKNKDVKNLCRQEKETEAIKGRLLEDLKNLSEHEN